MPTIENHRYLLLSTLRKNGAWVATPVWFAADDAYYYVFSAGNAGKVKRLRNFNTVKLAGCTVTGKQLTETIESNAVLISDPTSIQTANLCLNKKYGWQKRCLDIMAKLAGKYPQRQYIKIDKPR